MATDAVTRAAERLRKNLEDAKAGNSYEHGWYARMARWDIEALIEFVLGREVEEESKKEECDCIFPCYAYWTRDDDAVPRHLRIPLYCVQCDAPVKIKAGPLPENSSWHTPPALHGKKKCTCLMPTIYSSPEGRKGHCTCGAA